MNEMIDLKYNGEHIRRIVRILQKLIPMVIPSIKYGKHRIYS